MNLKGKTVLIGVCGGIAAYKVCEVVSTLVKNGADVYVMMTANATQFVSPLTFETLSNNPVVVESFKRTTDFNVEHISLAKRADICLIAPATANIIGKLACGIADDFLTTTVLACTCELLIAPAMNTAMYMGKAVKTNLEILIKRNATIIDSESGRLACGDIGSGRLAQPNVLIEAVTNKLFPIQDLKDKNVLISGGSTKCYIDAVRYITNASSGKMALALACEAYNRGANVKLVLGLHTVEIPPYIEVVDVQTTQQMYEQIISRVDGSDIIIMAAAPSDYVVDNYMPHKIKERNISINLTKTIDIAAEIGKIRGNRKLVIFAAETDNLIDNAKLKLKAKNADLCVANDVTVEGAGFYTDTNKVSLIDRSGKVTDLPLMSKAKAAKEIFDKINNIKVNK